MVEEGGLALLAKLLEAVELLQVVTPLIHQEHRGRLLSAPKREEVVVLVLMVERVGWA